MDFAFSASSLSKLDGVHPDLVRVAKRAIEISPIDFGITDGVRSQTRQLELVGQGKSHDEDSQHLLKSSGYGHAIDVYAWVNSKMNWTNRTYGPIVQAFFTAAIEEEVQIRAGHLWLGLHDSVHIELSRDYY